MICVALIHVVVERFGCISIQTLENVIMSYFPFVQENKGSPKERVFTLPSISEDEEVSDSEEELKLNEKQRDDDEDDDSQASSHLMSPSASVSSPLLSKLGKLPNGDIDVFNR